MIECSKLLYCCKILGIQTHPQWQQQARRAASVNLKKNNTGHCTELLILFGSGCSSCSHYRKTHICRVPDHGHSAKICFAECQTTGTRQSCGTRHAQTLPSAGRRQRKALGIARLCRVPAGEHSAKTAHVPSTRVRRATAVRVADGR